MFLAKQPGEDTGVLASEHPGACSLTRMTAQHFSQLIRMCSHPSMHPCLPLSSCTPQSTWACCIVLFMRPVFCHAHCARLESDLDRYKPMTLQSSNPTAPSSPCLCHKIPGPVTTTRPNKHYHTPMGICPSKRQMHVQAILLMYTCNE